MGSNLRDRVIAIVLAAGASRRMGRPKALLRCGAGGETFVARITRTLQAAGVAHVVVVGRPHDAALRREVETGGPAASYVTNPAPERGQLSSLLAGLAHAESRGAESVLVMPVDIPLVAVETIRAALAAHEASGSPITRATHAGRHGHPVLFRRLLFRDLREADPAVGAKAVLRAHADAVLNVEVPDPGVLRDVDVPEEYEELFGAPPEGANGS